MGKASRAERRRLKQQRPPAQPEARTAAAASPLRTWVLGILLALATTLAYARVLGAGYIWDDDDYVYKNRLLPASDGLSRIWGSSESPQYYPLVFTTFWIEYRLWGTNPAGYHAVNLFLHVLNSLLLWRLLARIGLPGAFVAAAVFALHPVHVESVAWITERKNVLSGAAYLLAFHAYLRYQDTGRRAWYAASFGAYLLGLFAKTVIASFPVAVLLVGWWKRREVRGTTGGPRTGRSGIRLSDAFKLLPFLVAGAALGAFTGRYEHLHVLHGATTSEWALGAAGRVLVAGRALWFYPAKLVWPAPLVFSYPRWEIDPGDVRQWLWPLAAVAAVGPLWWLSRRLGRGVIAGPLFYAVTIVPALGFVNVAPMRYSFVADHFQYLASVGIIATIVGLAAVWLGRHGKRRAIAASLAVLAVLATLTWRQTGIYRDVETLWRHTLRYNPDSSLALMNLGVILRQRGEIDAARKHFERLLEKYPDWWEWSSGAHTNLGNIDFDRGDLESAAAHFETALRIVPNHKEARFNLGNARLRAGRFAEAAEQYRTVLGWYPDHVKARLNLGVALESMGQVAEAEAQYRQILAAEPGFALAHLRLGHLARKAGRLEEAAASYRQALALNPRLDAARTALAEIAGRTP